MESFLLCVFQTSLRTTSVPTDFEVGGPSLVVANSHRFFEGAFPHLSSFFRPGPRNKMQHHKISLINLYTLKINKSGYRCVPDSRHPTKFLQILRTPQNHQMQVWILPNQSQTLLRPVRSQYPTSWQPSEVLELLIKISHFSANAKH